MDSPAIVAARQFVALLWDGEAPKDMELLAALDRLIAAYHDTPDAFPSHTDIEAPREDGGTLYKALAGRFPDYGFYPLAAPRARPDEAAAMGDAIDDLADLTLHMREVLWLAEHQGIDDAHWSFRLHFFHWGPHARELALYLHARLW